MEALTSARKAAAELAAKDDFDGALKLLNGLPLETRQLLSGELKTATDEIVASARKRVGAIEADLTKQLAAADFESARAQLAVRLLVGVELREEPLRPLGREPRPAGLLREREPRLLGRDLGRAAPGDLDPQQSYPCRCYRKIGKVLDPIVCNVKAEGHSTS